MKKLKAHYATTDYTTAAVQRYPTDPPSVQDYYPYVAPTAATSSPDGVVGQSAYNVNITNSYTYYTAQQYATHPHGQSVNSATVHHPLTGAPSINLGVGSLPQPETSPDSQKDDKDGNPTYDWMKIRRNPPKTTRKSALLSITRSKSLTMISITRNLSEIIFQKHFLRLKIYN